MNFILPFCLILFSVSANGLFPFEFNCPQLPPRPSPPSGARDLRPDDVDLLFALGDSMSAGCFAASQHIDDLIEYRELSFSIGRADGHATLCNFIRYFNPGVEGCAIGETIPLDVLHGKSDNISLNYTSPEITKLNAAISMAKLEDVWTELDYLQKHMPSYGAENKNVVGTILIGANDLCVCCDGRDNSKPEIWAQHFDQVLQRIYDVIPRKNLFLNVIATFNISQVWTWDNTDFYCRNFRHLFEGECPCLDPDDAAKRTAMDVFAQEYNKQLQIVVKKWNDKNLKDFYIGYQPYTTNMKIPNLAFLSKLDCFHPSVDAHNALAVGLWYNMVGKKITNLPYPYAKYAICPDANTRFK